MRLHIVTPVVSFYIIPKFTLSIFYWKLERGMCVWNAVSQYRLRSLHVGSPSRRAINCSRLLTMAVESAWGEVRKLAADLQRLQLSSTAHRLTERSCIELVGTLMSRNILEVLYTLDGKEYVTEDQLVREVKQELVAHGGNS